MTVHFSIDDVGSVLPQEGCGSLFDSPFFGKLKEWHDKYALCVTCYCYAMFDGRLISEIPDTLSHEFKKNRKWLRFGFHAKRDLALIDETGYKAGFNLVRGTLRRLGAGETDTIRCHYWNASMQQKEFLRLNGIKALLTQDDNKLPYGDDDSYTDCGLHHIRTRVRFEELEAVTPQTLHIGRVHVAVFTHEWCFDKQIEKIEKALILYRNNGYKFVT